MLVAAVWLMAALLVIKKPARPVRWDKMNAVEIQDLTYTYPGAAQPTLRESTLLTIPQGDFLAVVGNNGCGKSTLCKSPEWIDSSFYYRGAIMEVPKSTVWTRCRPTLASGPEGGLCLSGL